MHTAIALQQPLDLTAPLGVQVLKHRRNVRASRWQSYLGETQARWSLLRNTSPHVCSTTWAGTAEHLP